MMAMMGALDGQPTVAWQQSLHGNQENTQNQGMPKRGGRMMNGALEELRNLQNIENSQQKRGKGKTKPLGGKENSNFIDSPLRMSQLRGQENVELYRVTQDGNFYPNFLRVEAERDDSGVRFPHIREAWRSQNNIPPQRGNFDMPLLQVDRTVPAHKFPASQRSQSLPRYQAEPGYFRPPGMSAPPPVQALPPRQADSPDSGIGIPLLRFQHEEERQRRQPRFGELLPPDMVIESAREAEQKELLKERYLREYHQLQVSCNALSLFSKYSIL